MKIRITQKDIDSSSPYSFSNPIAIALSRVFGEDFEVYYEVIMFSSTFSYDSGWSPGIQLNLPEVVQKFLHKFDRTAKVKPFTFELPID